MRGPRTAMKSGPHLPQLEKALARKRRPNTAKNKINKLNFLKSPEEVRDNFKASKKTLDIWRKLGISGLLPIFPMKIKWEGNTNERMSIIVLFLLQQIEKQNSDCLRQKGKERSSSNGKSGGFSCTKAWTPSPPLPHALPPQLQRQLQDVLPPSLPLSALLFPGPALLLLRCSSRDDSRDAQMNILRAPNPAKRELSFFSNSSTKAHNSNTSGLIWVKSASQIIVGKGGWTEVSGLVPPPQNRGCTEE